MTLLKKTNLSIILIGFEEFQLMYFNDIMTPINIKNILKQSTLSRFIDIRNLVD
jgi:hypothetical protein